MRSGDGVMKYSSERDGKKREAEMGRDLMREMNGLFLRKSKSMYSSVVKGGISVGEMSGERRGEGTACSEFCRVKREKTVKLYIRCKMASENLIRRGSKFAMS